MGSAEEADHTVEGRGRESAGRRSDRVRGWDPCRIISAGKQGRARCAQTLKHEAQPVTKQAKSEAKKVTAQLSHEVRGSAQDAANT